MTIGIVDVGSNTIRMNIYKIENQSFQVIMSKKETVGLVSYIKKKKLSKEGIQVLKETLNNFKEIAQMIHLEGFYVFATASLRNIENSEEVLSIIQKKCKINIDLLSGKEEGRISFKGAKSTLKGKKGLYVDTGGGSTEILSYNGNETKDIVSLPVGSLNLFQNYVEQLIPTKKEAQRIMDAVESEYKKVYEKKTAYLSITGGSMRAIRKLLVHLGKIGKEDYIFDSQLIHDLYSELINMESKEVTRLFLKVKADRVHTLFTGLLIIDTLIRLTEAKEVQVSIYGIREGYLMERVLKL